MNGQMLWFDEAKDYGFIRTEDGERLYVQRDGFLNGAPVGRCAGLEVHLNVDERDGRRIAIEVSVVPEASPRRARRRTSGARGSR